MLNLIDTIKLRYDVDNSEQLNSIVNLLSDNYTDTFEAINRLDGSVRYRCYIKNLRVTVYPNCIYIEGSIQKFYAGNNVENLYVESINDLFQSLNSHFGNLVDMSQAFVRRLDIATNFIMSFKPTVYINKIHSASTNKLINYKGQTIFSGNASRGMLIYDKTTEAKKEARKTKSSILIPENLLRLEASIKNRYVFKKWFGIELPTVDRLLEQLHKLPEIWYDEYRRLVKEYDTNINYITNQKELFSYAISKTGFENSMYVINCSHDLNMITKQDWYRFTRTVKAVFKEDSAKANDYDLMKELDNKVDDFLKSIKYA